MTDQAEKSTLHFGVLWL
ncbi:Low affinity tryptophan permease [Shigella boydii]|uniref:Low affinity tryptophan permease n=1 Tax=Escherichia coli TaxID=562 RepID=Q5UEV5_ECOLX|nr:low affinity tryptophan permease [Escherichia coli]AAV34640.1 low affinity tryptophan permease [Escherichia coli]AAV34642.1 low affinity tryptophan permease [Escherichia coli]AAV34644.1 low affinity tryptophan permease [Escherichia coli]AAV34646.1 low affinity tryptophan permease [Escherichia coli]